MYGGEGGSQLINLRFTVINTLTETKQLLIVNGCA